MAKVNSLIVGCYNDDFVLRIPCDGGGYLATSPHVLPLLKRSPLPAGRATRT